MHVILGLISRTRTPKNRVHIFKLIGKYIDYYQSFWINKLNSLSIPIHVYVQAWVGGYTLLCSLPYKLSMAARLHGHGRTFHVSCLSSISFLLYGGGDSGNEGGNDLTL